MALACGCVALAVATTAMAAVGPTQADTNTEASAASEPRARAASDRLRARYRRWRSKLERYGVWRGRNLVRAAASNDRAVTARELRRSIRRMKRRFANWSTTYEGRDPRAVGGGGAYRGLYQFSFSTWRVVGGSGDPAAAPRSEQTWRAWVLLKNHGSGHWPVCG
jgi:hypothetical protein